ncbi:uncharacterized protein BXZ73DRAFT_44026 [Epithele typhae]|uniref:uncharacterized protein n=1 Tax=Epithele typhae TaxID=378194 RepID=UPI0020087833|nr:uncharacterized protein BXZ73DRAFT_44026 [Epithele typhae]KAH9938958.1 hypothetical protein BXZ73DRAFT_44026 [Epithele typhae]
MRPIISYDDITPPPAKKRKTAPNYRQGQGQYGGRQGPPHQAVQHWDDPGIQGPQMPYEDAPLITTTMQKEEEDEEDESRELTHGEIWDDSALIDAWNSAAAEYEAYHGPGKKWKNEPVKKSPLWYNIPPDLPPTSKTSSAGVSTSTPQNGGEGEDSAPLNFDTFVPTHDPSLATAMAPAAGMDGNPLGTGSETAMVSQDEAFSRAMAAMYWSGYWTAVYHSRRNETRQANGSIEQDDGAFGEDEDGQGAEDEEDEEMLPAQR